MRKVFTILSPILPSHKIDWLGIIFLLIAWSGLPATDTFLERAIDVYRLQYRSLKNYQCLQTINMQTRDNYGITIREKRKQWTYYLAPDTYYHRLLSKEINQIRQFIPNRLDKTRKMQENWLLADRKRYQFSPKKSFRKNRLCYFVKPVQGNSKSITGWVCFHPQNYRLLEISYRPHRNPKSIDSYWITVQYTTTLPYPVPQKTFLKSRYQSKKLKYQLQITIDHKDYRFNRSITKDVLNGNHSSDSTRE